jgi:hypothetical protein
MPLTDASTFTDFLNNYLTKITNIINAETSTVNTILTSLNQSSLAEITDLTKKVNSQNQQIDKQITAVYSNTNRVKDINTKYEDLELTIIRNYNHFLLIIYYAIVIFFALILFYFRPATLYINLGILALFIVYPFFIIYIEIAFYTIYRWIYTYITKNPLTSNIYIQNV